MNFALARNICIAALTLFPLFALSDARPQADQIYLGGEVLTPSGWKQAFAVKDGVIIATGTDGDIKSLAASGAKTVNLHGKTVLPGLYDMHVHPLEGGMDSLSCHIDQGVDAQKLLDVVRGCVKAAKPGDWIVGGQWQAASMGNTPVTRQTLDAVSPDNPVILYDISGHSNWVNSRALQLGGIDRRKANPEGGIIEHDQAGEPTGILRETAKDLVTSLVPPPSPEINAAALERGLNTMLSYGVTSITDAQLLKDNIVAYRTLADQGKLKIHVLGCIAYAHAEDFETLLADRAFYARPNFRTDCVKVFMDGVPTDSHTAAMLAPYRAGQKNAPPLGLLLVQPEELNAKLIAWDKMGLTVKFHSVGDHAVRAALDAVEAARKANGPGGPPHNFGHITFISEADMPRARALGATWEFSPYLWSPQPINDDITKAIGTERIKRVWPIREGFASKALVVAGSDWPVIPAPDPWLALETSVTRKVPGGDGKAFGGGEAITLQQAFEMFTINAARQMGDSDKRGTLETGKRADFIVTDRNLFHIPVTEIHTIKVQETYIDGERVYAAGQ